MISTKKQRLESDYIYLTDMKKDIMVIEGTEEHINAPLFGMVLMAGVNKAIAGAGASTQQQSSGVGVPTKGPLSQTGLGTRCRPEALSSCLKAAPTDDSGPTFSDEEILAKRRAATNRLLIQEATASSHQHTISHYLLATGNLRNEGQNGFSSAARPGVDEHRSLFTTSEPSRSKATSCTRAA